MRALISSGICALIIILAAPQASMANDRPVSAQCTVVRFPDMMDIRECVGGPLGLCGERKTDLRSTSQTLARCLVKSMAKTNFLKIVFRGLVQAGIYAMQASLPGSSVLAFPVLYRLRNTFGSPRAQDKIILTSRPCNQTVEVSFPDFLRIGSCVRPEHFMCTKTGWMDLRTQVLTSLLRMVVCVMRKLPFFNVLFLMKDMMCTGLNVFRKWLENRGIFPIAGPITEFFEVIFVCNAQNAVQSSVERKLLGKLGFNLE